MSMSDQMVNGDGKERLKKTDAPEEYWLGPRKDAVHSPIYHMQCADGSWFQCGSGDIILHTNYSDFSVRLQSLNQRSLSFVNNTVAILPKSRLREIYNLIGRYLDHETNNSKKDDK